MILLHIWENFDSRRARVELGLGKYHDGARGLVLILFYALKCPPFDTVAGGCYDIHTKEWLNIVNIVTDVRYFLNE